MTLSAGLCALLFASAGLIGGYAQAAFLYNPEAHQWSQSFVNSTADEPALQARENT
jgi:hypothetical protein